MVDRWQLASATASCPKSAAPLDVDALIRTTVGKIQNQGAAEAERLCEAIQKAIDVLQQASA